LGDAGEEGGVAPSRGCFCAWRSSDCSHGESF
jgi:hypothetical protein